MDGTWQKQGEAIDNTNTQLMTVVGKPSKDVPIGTLKSILQQAQLDEEK